LCLGVLLYHILVRFQSVVCAVGALVWLGGLAPPDRVVGVELGGGVSRAGLTRVMVEDRLDRFRRLAASRLAALEVFGGEPAVDAFREIYELLDDEILENLEAGTVFASEGFLQVRLDAFSEVWGGSTFRILVLPGGDLTVGSFQLSPGPQGNSVRIYRRNGVQVELLRVIYREGIPRLHAMPPTRAGEGQFLVLWVGPPTPRGTTALRVELWREQHGRLRLAWSLAESLGPEVYARDYTVRGRELGIRHEVRYRGWKPGCAGQTEHEDLYRYDPASGRFILATRQVYNGWHRELHARVTRLFAALRRHDRKVLAEMGLDRVPQGLPERLEPEPACDILDGPSPRVATVTATDPGDPHPWAFHFRRTAQGWQFAGVERLPYPVRQIPVLE
ncbi:MAG: hypothetical protein ACE5FK_03430, partial [Candidatus Methylomirabilia bacterium]